MILAIAAIAVIYASDIVRASPLPEGQVHALPPVHGPPYPEGPDFGPVPVIPLIPEEVRSSGIQIHEIQFCCLDSSLIF